MLLGTVHRPSARSFVDHSARGQAEWVGGTYRVRRVAVRVEPSHQSDGIVRDEPGALGVVDAEAVVAEAGGGVLDLTREAQGLLAGFGALFAVAAVGVGAAGPEGFALGVGQPGDGAALVGGVVLDLLGLALAHEAEEGALEFGVVGVGFVAQLGFGGCRAA